MISYHISTGSVNRKLPFLRINKKEIPKGRPHIGIYTLQIGSFSPNTATKFHGRRQPCRGILSCLVKKSLALECFAVLNRRFFFTAATGDRVNTGCIPRETGAVVEKKIHSKPCKSLCESAQTGISQNSRQITADQPPETGLPRQQPE